jgi:acetoin utilization protein AcuB
MKDKTIADYMTSSPHSIGYDQSLTQAHHVMREHHIRHLPVLRAGRLVGLVSDRDLAFAENLKDVDAAKLRVDEAMTATPYSVAKTTRLGDVAREMAEHRYGSAVVMENDHVVGVFTTVDALRALADAYNEKS